MYLKRMLCLLLSLVLYLLPLSGYAAGGIIEGDGVAEAEEMEFARAVEYGLFPQEWLDDPDAKLTHAEFCAMVRRLIELVKPECLPAWEELAAKAMASNSPIERDSAMAGLLYAAQALDICYANTSEYPLMDDIETETGFWDFRDEYPLWPQLPEGYQMFGLAPGRPSIDGGGYSDWQGCTGNTAFWFVLQRLSIVSELPLITWDENYNLHINEVMTRREAALSVLRLGESEPNLMDGNHYIHVDEVGSYDKSIITDALLNAPSDLPIPTQEKLTSEWKGMGISKCKDVRSNYMDFHESDVAFLAENGMNFTNVFFGFPYLRYPDYPEDIMQVNETELRDLDQLIAWGMEYGVHIQLSMTQTPTDYDGIESEYTLDLPDSEWEAIYAYWNMLARRYADIPSQYLSFNLAEEIQPGYDNVEAGLERLRVLKDGIWAIDPDRVILMTFHANPWPDWAEGVASMGLAMGVHPNSVGYLNTGSTDGFYVVPDHYWPYPYFPQVLLEGEELSISGEIGGKTLGLSIGCYNPFDIRFDNGEVLRVDLVDGNTSDPLCGGPLPDLYRVQIPEGVSSLSILGPQNDLAFDEIGIEAEGESHYLTWHDEGTGTDCSKIALDYSAAEGWSSERNRSMDNVYDEEVAPYVALAEKYNVGLMVNELGLYSTYCGFDVDIKIRHDRDKIDMLESHGISWCVNEKVFIVLYAEEYPGYPWENATVVEEVFVSDDGYRQTSRYSPELMAVYANR